MFLLKFNNLPALLEKLYDICAHEALLKHIVVSLKKKDVPELHEIKVDSSIVGKTQRQIIVACT